MKGSETLNPSSPPSPLTPHPHTPHLTHTQTQPHTTPGIAQPALDPKIIANRCTLKWVKEFQYLRATATGMLARFMDFVR